MFYQLQIWPETWKSKKTHLWILSNDRGLGQVNNPIFGMDVPNGCLLKVKIWSVQQISFQIYYRGRGNPFSTQIRINTGIPNCYKFKLKFIHLLRSGYKFIHKECYLILIFSGSLNFKWWEKWLITMCPFIVHNFIVCNEIKNVRC